MERKSRTLLKKLIIGTIMLDVLSHSKLEIINITAENIDGWSTYLELKREDGTTHWQELKTVVALINADLLDEYIGD